MDTFIKTNKIQFDFRNDNQLDFLNNITSESIETAILDHKEVSDIVCQLIEKSLKKGGICMCIATTKTLNDVINEFSKVGMMVKDIIAWVNPAIQATSFGCNYLVKKSKDIPESEKDKIIEELKDKRTAKLRNCFIPIVILQKPIETFKTLVHNQLTNNCGLINNTRTASGVLSSNVITTEFIDNYSKAFLIHRTPFKPPDDIFRSPMTRVMFHLLDTFTHEDSTILDVATDDGALLYASLTLRRNYIGNEILKSKYNTVKDTLDQFIMTIPDNKNLFIKF